MDTASHHPNILLSPRQPGTRGASGPRRRAPFPSARQYQHRSCRGASAGGGRQRGSRLLPGFPSKTLLRFSPPALHPACALSRPRLYRLRREDGSLFPRSHPRRGYLAGLGDFPVPSAGAGVPGAQRLYPAR